MGCTHSLSAPTIVPSVSNLTLTPIEYPVEVPLTFKQDDLSGELSYTGFVPVELPYYVDSSTETIYAKERWEILCSINIITSIPLWSTGQDTCLPNGKALVQIGRLTNVSRQRI